MSIKITADSTCDLPQDLLERYQISIVPLYVNLDGVVHRDGVDIVPGQIFDHVAAGGNLPTTAAINIADYTEFFAPLAAQHEAVIHINISQDFSSCHQNAVFAAGEFDNVFVVDSRNLSCWRLLWRQPGARRQRISCPIWNASPPGWTPPLWWISWTTWPRVAAALR